MKISAAVELVWNMAAQEAIAAEFKDIEPEHLCEALLKFSELNDLDFGRIGIDPGVTTRLAGERETLRRTIETHSLDPTPLRRALRMRLGKGGTPYDSGTMHRSDASREAFAAAQRIAERGGQDCLSSEHLLLALIERPTPIMAALLKGQSAAPAKDPNRATMLARYTRDLTQLVASSARAPSSQYLTVVKALIEVLGKAPRPVVWLVGGSKDAAAGIVLSAAQLLLDARAAPSPWRVLEVVGMRLTAGASREGEVAERLNGVLAEATDPRLIVYVTDVDAVLTSEPSLVADLVRGLQRAPLRCVCAISEAAYDRHVRSNGEARRFGHVMWVRASAGTAVPREL